MEGELVVAGRKEPTPDELWQAAEAAFAAQEDGWWKLLQAMDLPRPVVKRLVDELGECYVGAWRDGWQARQEWEATRDVG